MLPRQLLIQCLPLFSRSSAAPKAPVSTIMTCIHVFGPHSLDTLVLGPMLG